MLKLNVKVTVRAFGTYNGQTSIVPKRRLTVKTNEINLEADVLSKERTSIKLVRLSVLWLTFTFTNLALGSPD